MVQQNLKKLPATNWVLCYAAELKIPPLALCHLDLLESTCKVDTSSWCRAPSSYAGESCCLHPTINQHTKQDMITT